MDNTAPIQLLVFDIDGVLSSGEAEAVDLSFLQHLASMNRSAREYPSCPGVTLCTGRPAPYVELMLQVIDGRMPAIFENGTGLYVPDGYRFLRHPGLETGHSLHVVKQRLQSAMVDTGLAYFQPGKEFSLTLFANDPAETGNLLGQVDQALGSLRELVDLVYSSSCLNVLPHGIHKGRGIQFLADQTNISPAAMLGVGDSDIDLPFLSKVGYSAAPSNANPEVKSTVQYVSSKPTVDGVLDILDHFKVKYCIRSMSDD